MPEVWQQSRKVFLGAWPVKDPPNRTCALLDEARMETEVNEGTMGWLHTTLRPSRLSPGFFLADVAGTDGDVVLLHRDGRDGTLDVCGGYVGPSLWIEHTVRDQGLSAELILAKARLLDGRLQPQSYTTLGYKAHASAHRLAVQTALAEGRAVPSQVLRDYPDLADIAPAASRAIPAGHPAAAAMAAGRR